MLVYHHLDDTGFSSATSTFKVVIKTTVTMLGYFLYYKLKGLLEDIKV